MSSSELLGVYLEDHHGGSTAGLELAERLRDEHDGTPLGTVMAGLAADIKEDRAVLEELIERVEASQSTVKQAAGWLAEKLSRLRSTPQLTGSAELSTLLQTETLSLGIEGKRCMWLALKHLAEVDRRLAGTDFDLLVRRAEIQRDTLEPYRVEAAVQAFAQPRPSRP
jgi:hypothetical protein